VQQSVAPAPLAGKIFRSCGSYLARLDLVARYERIEEVSTEYLTRAGLASKDARKTARMYGTPLYVWEDGKVVAKKP